MTNTIDKLVMETGKTSYSYELQKYQTTYYQTNKIIELIERKRKMINLKVVVEQVLSKLSTNSRKILMLFYIDGVKTELIAKLLNISLRTFFRQKVKAIKDFSDNLEKLGFNIDFFNREYGNQRWFLSIYDDCVSKSNVYEYVPDGRLINRVINEVRKVNFAYNTYI